MVEWCEFFKMAFSKIPDFQRRLKTRSQAISNDWESQNFYWVLFSVTRFLILRKPYPSTSGSTGGRLVGILPWTKCLNWKKYRAHWIRIYQSREFQSEKWFENERIGHANLSQQISRISDRKSSLGWFTGFDFFLENFFQYVPVGTNIKHNSGLLWVDRYIVYGGRTGTNGHFK